MRNNTSQDTSQILERQRKRRIWLKIVGALSCVVVFCTTYALILPAITLEKKAACGKEEHIHTEGCYTQVTAVQKTVPICTPESLTIHHHSDGCLDENGGLCCGEADFVVHTHDGRCYDENGQLWCPILEKKAHTHDEGCYTKAEAHVHGESCYQKEQGELICAESTEPVHTHGEVCYAPEKTLVCALTEGEGHQHGEGCLDESGAQVCTQTESEGHKHSESCYESVLTCTESTEPAHVHTDKCYNWNSVLTCTEPTDPAEAVLTCAKEEIRLHEHTQESCYKTDENGSLYLACKQPRILEHVHTDACFQTVEAPVDPEALTCQLEESESHQHSALCYGAWELSCGLEEHTHSEECSAPPQNNLNAAEAPAAKTTPLTLDGYISGATLSYRVSPDVEWKKVDATKPLPGNAELRLEISYKDIHVNDLRAAGLKVTYTLPEILRAQTGSGPILDNDKNHMGTMDVTAENRSVALTFDETWLKNHHGTAGHEQISGTFYVDSGIDLSQAGNNPPTQITVGKVNIGLNFENDIIAKYADVKIQKECASKAIHDDSGDYLEYTLTVTAGQDGAPNVVVKDAFQDPTQILGYVSISPETPVGSGNGPVETVTPNGQAGTYSMDVDGTTMVWNIGNMAANETRTLTYRVKMKEGYLGGKVPNNPVVNTAEIFCGEHRRGDATGKFTPKAEATLSKVAAQFTPDPDGNGGGTITYTIWIHADKENNYTLTNVKIWDALDGSIDGRNVTEEKYRKYLSYVSDSFHLYKGGSNMQNGTSGLEPVEGSPTNPVFQKLNGTPDDYCFSYDAGTLAPGESKTLTYTLHVEPGVFPAAGNNTPKINNRAQIHAGDKAKDNETSLESYGVGSNIQKKTWSSKHPGTKQETENTVKVPSSDNVYGSDGSRVENPLTEFTVPAGSYLYQVTVNEAKDWNVSEATLKDQLQGAYSKYVGYVKVDAYDVDTSTPSKTVWLAVDGLTEFTFTPSSLGFTGKQAYELTYYTQVKIPAGASQIKVDNSFTMNGSVGIGTYSYVIEGATVTASNIIQGSNSFTVSKHSWYYEPSRVETGEYANGAIYWYIQVAGSEIPANTYLKDVTSWNTQFMYPSSLVGLYKGNLGNGSVADYDDLAHLLSSGKLTRLDESGYSSEIAGTEGRFPTMTVRLINSVSLSAGESLFLIIKIEPHLSPADLTGAENRNYHNAVESSYDGTNWVPWGEPKNMALFGNNGISKTLEKVSSWNGTTETVVSPEGATADQTALAGLESGTYVSWKVQLNYPGRLHGSYYVEEIIPDGMELAYVQCTDVGAGYTGTKPSCVQKNLEAGWTENTREVGAITTYYYTNGQTARWYVEGLQTGGNNHTVDFRVVCRVTDKDVLLGGTQKEFQNEVNLCRENGKPIDSSSSPVSIQTHSLSKKGIYTQEEPTKYPFEITLNPLGEDLVPGADTLSLVDTLSETLKLDLSSIQVKETGTDTVVTGWESAVDGQTLTLTLPDQKALTVTYSALINARPGDTISISNNAHWEGYATPSSGGVKNDNFAFEIQGSAGTSEYPGIQITKRDANHLSTVLAGADFSLTKAEVKADGTIGELNDPLTDTIWTGTTNANGSLSFSTSTEDGKTMNYNTIYCLRETKAPAGYVLDGTPHYFVVAKKDESGKYPSFPEKVHVHYFDVSPVYSYDALNQKGRITVQKKFADAGGNDYPPVAGTYTFGLYNSGTPTGDPIRTASITYDVTDTEYKAVVFQDLPLDTPYYVFELDADGQPIANNGSLSDLFVVSYGDSNCVTLTTDIGDQAVTVTNCIYTPELPETGGIGTTVFYTYAAGLILLAGAAVLLLAKKRVSDKT